MVQRDRTCFVDSDLEADDLPTLQTSRSACSSMTERTMTRILPRRHQKIKSFTPMTQLMAKRRIHHYFERRSRSVQNVSDSMHSSVLLDSDLEQIRTDFMEQKRSSELEQDEIWSGGLVMVNEDEAVDQLDGDDVGPPEIVLIPNSDCLHDVDCTLCHKEPVHDEDSSVSLSLC